MIFGGEMSEKVTFQAAFVAAIVAIVAMVAMGLSLRPHAGPGDVQPSVPSGPVPTFVQLVNEHPRHVLRFFAADTLFVLCYITVYAGLYIVTVGRSGVFAGMGLGAGILAAVLDVTENAFFIVYALLAMNGDPLTDPDIPLIYILTNLKYVASYVAFLTFGWAWPRTDWLGWTIFLLMLLFPLVGAMSVAWPVLVGPRSYFFLVGMLLYALYFLRRARRT
jgi:hypothetical protein